MDMPQPPAIYWTTDANAITIKQPKPLLPVKLASGKPKKVLSFQEEARKRRR